MRRIKAGFMLIEILLALAAIIFIVFKVSKLYLKPPVLNQQTQKIIAEQGIDTTSYKTIIDSTSNRVEDIQKKHFDDLNRLEAE
jgi:hypothetical protein